MRIAFRMTVVALLGAVLACSSGEDGECTTNDDCGDGLICSFNSCVENSGGIPIGGGNNTPGGNTNSNGNANDNGNGGGFDPSVDITPPTIVIREPDPFEPQTGIVQIVVDVIDTQTIPNGSTVRAIIADRIVVPLEALVGNVGAASELSARFTGFFDSTTLGTVDRVLAPSLTVVAEDVAGNEAQTGISFILDYAGPAIDMEPRLVRPTTIGTTQPGEDLGATNAVLCGAAFRMLGDSAVRDGDVISPNYPFGLAFYPRAEVIDRASEGPYSVPISTAGTDFDSIFIAFIDQNTIAAGKPLLVSGRDDLVCDQINPDVVPPAGVDDLAPEFAIIERMVQVSNAGGTPNFSTAAFLTNEPLINPFTQLPPPPSPCNTWGGLTDEDADLMFLCKDVDESITVWLPGELRNGSLTSRIFVMADYDRQSLNLCAGGFFDVRNFIADGPACLATFGRDVNGFPSASSPLYICIDKDGVGGECDGFNPTDSDRINACTNGCIPDDAGGNPDLDIPELFSFQR